VKAGDPGFPQTFVKNEVISIVENVNDREVLISFHQSKSVPAKSAADFPFKDHAPEGKWTVSTQLKSGEVCPSEAGAVVPDPDVIPVPSTLMLRIFYGCTP
jgi:hypothetical protein